MLIDTIRQAAWLHRKKRSNLRLNFVGPSLSSPQCRPSQWPLFLMKPQNAYSPLLTIAFCDGIAVKQLTKLHFLCSGSHGSRTLLLTYDPFWFIFFYLLRSLNFSSYLSILDCIENLCIRIFVSFIVIGILKRVSLIGRLSTQALMRSASA